MYKQGDELKLCSRPEWGVGHVTRVEHVTREGQRDQRVWIRFPNVGVKTILAGAAQIEQLNGDGGEAHTFAAREHAHETGWLGEISKKQPEQAMTSLPPETTDPFSSLRSRFRITAALYRFRPEGASLIDWAIAQSGLDDPLSRFNRHQLEEFFSRWAWERDEHARQLFLEAKRNGEAVDDLIKQADGRLHKALRDENARS